MQLSTEYTVDNPVGYEGMIVTASPFRDIISKAADADDTIKYGKLVVINATTDGICEPPNAIAELVATRILGVALANIDANGNPLNYLSGTGTGGAILAADLEFSDGYKKGKQVSILRRGYVWVRPEDAVTEGGAVHVRAVAAGAEILGSFRGAADGTDTAEVTAQGFRWRSDAAAGALAKLEVNIF